MSKYKKIIITALCIALLQTGYVTGAAPVKINDLIENPVMYDGKRISIAAEAIGEKMNRKDGTWVNIHDGSNAIGVWMTKAESEKISVYGGYGKIGDVLDISGVFHRHCVEHGGEPDIHLSSINAVKMGKIIENNISSAKIYSSAVLVTMAILILILFFHQSNRER